MTRMKLIFFVAANPAAVADRLTAAYHFATAAAGTDLAAEIRRRGLSSPVLLVSGYAQLEGVAADLPRLTKPFRRDELAQSLLALRR